MMRRGRAPVQAGSGLSSRGKPDRGTGRSAATWFAVAAVATTTLVATWFVAGVFATTEFAGAHAREAGDGLRGTFAVADKPQGLPQLHESESVRPLGETGPATASLRATASSSQDFRNLPYDGAYTFVRLRFNVGGRGGFGRGFGRGPPWAHDFPYADNNFAKLLDEVTLVGPHTDGTNVVSADSPELHRFPIAYVAEPGQWRPTRAEADNLSAYLAKGGFLILDDFRGSREWLNVESIFAAILPGHRFRQLDLDEPVFDSFFQIETLDFSPPTFRQYKPYFLGIHENDDPTGRLLVVANFNNDIGDYWEYSDTGWFPIDLSNEAYKVGINYVIYALTR